MAMEQSRWVTIKVVKDVNLFQGENPEDWYVMDILPNPEPAEDEVSCTLKSRVLANTILRRLERR